MNQPDEISQRLDRIARLLEMNGYAVEVDYTGALIIVWDENWPIVVAVKASGRHADVAVMECCDSSQLFVGG